AYDWVEYFSGAGKVSKAMREAGFVGVELDKLLYKEHRSMDFLTEAGFAMQSFFAQQYVYTTSIWGGAYANDPSEATPKRHVLYSNDPVLLSRLTTCAGHLTQEQLRALSGEPLVKKQKKADGTRTWQGCKETMGKS
ncbi:unnamed protein product, partial [Durusdinium trenchii]